MQIYDSRISCLDPAPFKCQCYPEKYFNLKTDKCEMLKEIDELCIQADSCKNGICSGSPLRCQNQLNISPFASSIATVLSTTTALIFSSTIEKYSQIWLSLKPGIPTRNSESEYHLKSGTSESE